MQVFLYLFIFLASYFFLNIQLFFFRVLIIQFVNICFLEHPWIKYFLFIGDTKPEDVDCLYEEYKIPKLVCILWRVDQL